MTSIVGTKSSLPRISAAGLAICALLAIETSAMPAEARDPAQQNLPYGYGTYYPTTTPAYGWPYGYAYYNQPYAYYYQPYAYYRQPYAYSPPYYGPPAAYAPYGW